MPTCRPFVLAAALAAAAALTPAAAADTFSDAVTEFRRAIDAYVLDEQAYTDFVAALERHGKLKGGVRAYLSLKNQVLRPDETVAHHMLSRALRQRGHAAEADATLPTFKT